MLWFILLVILSQQSNQETLVFDFTQNVQTALQNWYSINDVVMGGLSEGKIKADSQGLAIFFGIVRPDNFGGFASVRTDLDSTYRGYRGIRLRVKTWNELLNKRASAQIRLKPNSDQGQFQQAI